MSASDLTKVGLLAGERGAVISECGKYRYWLHRRWEGGNGWTVFIMLNPSTADALVDDPTIRKCVQFAKLFGSEGLIVVNLFAWRATDPGELYRLEHGTDLEGRENHAYVVKACEIAAMPEPVDITKPNSRLHIPGRVVCGWGTQPIAKRQSKTVLGWVDQSGADLQCLQRNFDGSPKHPLYIPYKTALQPYG